MQNVIEMRPTGRMKIWVAQRPLPTNAKLSDHALLKKLGYSKNLVWTWKRKYGPLWDDWALTQMRPIIEQAKNALTAVGMHKAMSGDYRYWKSMAMTYGVIKKCRCNR